MKSKRSENRRKTYLVDKEFQIKFILRFCLVVLIVSLVVEILLFFFSQKSATVAIENTQVIVKKTSDFLLPLLIQTLVIVSIFCGSAVFVLALLFSHKISGPLYRLKKEINKLKEADFRRNFSIRKSDELKDLAESLNQMCKALKERFLRIKERFMDLKEYLEKKEYIISKGDKEEVAKLIKELNEELDAIKTE